MFSGQRKFNQQVTLLLNSHYGIDTNNTTNPFFMLSGEYANALSLLRKVKRLNVAEASLFIAAHYLSNAMLQNGFPEEQGAHTLRKIKAHVAGWDGADSEIRLAVINYVKEKLYM